MKQRVPVLVLGVVVLALLWWLGGRMGAQGQGFEGQRVGVGLGVEPVRVTLELPEGPPLVLARRGALWVMPQRHDWPVDAERLRTFFVALHEARYARRVVEDTSGDAFLGLPGCGIVVEHAQGVRWSVSLGNRGPNGGTYVRPAKTAAAYLTDKTLEVRPDWQDWGLRRPFREAWGEVDGVRVEVASGSWEVVRRDEGFEVVGKPVGFGALRPEEVERFLETWRQVEVVGSVPLQEAAPEESLPERVRVVLRTADGQERAWELERHEAVWCLRVGPEVLPEPWREPAGAVAFVLPEGAVRLLRWEADRFFVPEEPHVAPQEEAAPPASLTQPASHG